MVFAFFDDEGLVYHHYAPLGSKILSSGDLGDVFEEFKKKRPHKAAGEWILRWDNSPLHTAGATTAFLEDKGNRIEWYYKYITNRHLYLELNKCTSSSMVGTGFPQGGVCSAKFWIIAYNQELKILNTHGVTGFGFADDSFFFFFFLAFPSALTLGT